VPGPRVTVIAPVYNNGPTLGVLCRRIRAAFHPDPVEIVLVDDGSTDGSRVAMEALDVRSVLHDRNRGQNQAILTGLGEATGEICCALDADLEDPPEALPDLVAALGAGGVAVAFASRDERRRLTSRVFRRVMRAAFPTLPRHSSLCFALDRPTRDRLLATAAPGDYLVAVIGAMGVRTTEVPIRRGLRETGRSGYAGLARCWYAARMLRSAFRWRVRTPMAGDRPGSDTR
jgi:polyisoprenyl-phosphate glycosyltransferase